MVTNCLEPEWEAVFEATSYGGFRPGRSAHDAITLIYNTLSVKANGINKQLWLLDADIERKDSSIMAVIKIFLKN